MTQHVSGTTRALEAGLFFSYLVPNVKMLRLSCVLMQTKLLASVGPLVTWRPLSRRVTQRPWRSTGTRENKM